MTTRLSQSEVYEFWTRQAREHGQSPSASWSDHCVIEMEIAEIAKHLADGDKVLDVGCANGYSSMQFACARRIAASRSGLRSRNDRAGEAAAPRTAR